MLKIMADANIEGHVKALASIMQRDPWDFYWRLLGVELTTFAEIGLDHHAHDRTVWNTVQSHNILLITDNRNEEDENSLQTTIRDSNFPQSLPVVTIGSAGKS